VNTVRHHCGLSSLSRTPVDRTNLAWASFQRECFVRIAAFIVLLLAGGLLAADSEVYKWVDEEGNVHYSDTPPENVESEEVHIDVAPAAGDGPTERLLKRAEQSRARLAEEREERAAAMEAEKSQHAADSQRCTYARQQMISLQQELPVYRDEAGKFRTLSQYDVYEGRREYLDDRQRAAEILRVQQDIEQYCEHPGDRGEQFVAAWDRRMSKRCEAARARLEAAEADRHSPRQTIEDAKAEVELYCKDED
jgi:hypothetical protein